MKKCNKCKIKKDEFEFNKNKNNYDGLEYYCRTCSKEKSKTYYARPDIKILKKFYDSNRNKTKGYKKSHRINECKFRKTLNGKIRIRKYIIKNPEKIKVQWLLNYAIKSGKIIKPNICSVCYGRFKRRLIQGHHFDYSKPLEVIWCCPQCHKDLHKRRI